MVLSLVAIPSSAVKWSNNNNNNKNDSPTLSTSGATTPASNNNNNNAFDASLIVAVNNSHQVRKFKSFFFCNYSKLKSLMYKSN